MRRRRDRLLGIATSGIDAQAAINAPCGDVRFPLKNEKWQVMNGHYFRLNLWIAYEK